MEQYSQSANRWNCKRVGSSILLHFERTEGGSQKYWCVCQFEFLSVDAIAVLQQSGDLQFHLLLFHSSKLVKHLTRRVGETLRLKHYF